MIGIVWRDMAGLVGPETERLAARKGDLEEVHSLVDDRLRHFTSLRCDSVARAGL